ncbi:MAG: TA system VapC family ribonuclease toxin [Rhodoferax sp.]
MTPDVNVLVAAFRTDHPHHASARHWLTLQLTPSSTKASTLHLLPVVVAGFLRVTTHPKVFQQPDTMEDAVAFIDSLMAYPHCAYQATSAAWAEFKQVCLRGPVKAALVSDALIAANVVQTGDILATFDRDFHRLLKPHQLTVLT